MSGEPTAFQLYTCKDCGEIGPDPVTHSKKKGHYSGYVVRNIPLELEETSSQRKSKKEHLRTAAERVIAERGV
jgi:hypothetical protein